MKKLLLLIIMMFLPLSVYADDIVIDERITDIYFANGIMVTREQALASSKLIYEDTKENIYNNNITAMKRETSFDLLYNETYNMFWDKLETFKQKKMDDRWFWVMVDTAYSGGCGYLTGGAANALERWF